MASLGFAIQIHADEQAFIGAGFGIEYPVVCRAEMRSRSAIAYPHRLTTRGRNPVDTGLVGARWRGKAAAFLLFKHHCLAIGREARAGIMAGLRRDNFGHATICANGSDVAKAFICPMHIRNCLTVPRPCGISFHLGRCRRQAPRCAAACGLEPQFTHGFEHYRPAIGRRDYAARHVRLKRGWRDFNRWTRRVNHAAGI